MRELALDKAVERRKVSKPTPIKDHKALAQILALLGQHRLVREFKIADQQAHDALHRDRTQRQQLVEAQLQDGSTIDQKCTHLRQQAFGLIKDMRSDRDRLIAKLTEPQPVRRQRQSKRERLSREPHQGPRWEP